MKRLSGGCVSGNDLPAQAASADANIRLSFAEKIGEAPFAAE
jgi:hypothetical protein